LNWWNLIDQNRYLFQYKLKICSNKECCKQCRYVKFKGTVTKWPVKNNTQNDTKTRTTSWRNRHLEKLYFSGIIHWPLYNIKSHTYVYFIAPRCIFSTLWLLGGAAVAWHNSLQRGLPTPQWRLQKYVHEGWSRISDILLYFIH